MLRYLRRLSPTQEMAEELLQETFARAMRTQGPTPSSNDIRPWLYRIATNIAIDQSRRARRFRFIPFVGIWATLQADVLDRRQFADLAAAKAAVLEYAGYYNYHRLHGEIGWLTPAERYDGTPFTDRGFENIPPLRDIAELLTDLLRAA